MWGHFYLHDRLSGVKALCGCNETTIGKTSEVPKMSFHQQPIGSCPLAMCATGLERSINCIGFLCASVTFFVAIKITDER